MREIVTIQVGNFANYIGSHFWNFQDELLGLAEDPESDQLFRNQCLDMDVLYRTGETLQGVPTYTPRLLSVGFQGSLGSMSSQGTLYNEAPSIPSDIVTWTGNISTHASEPQKKNLFLRSLYNEEHNKSETSGKTDCENENCDKDIAESLENGVQFWTDYSKAHYHPQSLYELNGLWMGLQEFDNYGLGKNAFSEGQRGEEMNERLRFFIEECDHIQGFQFVIDDSGGFSGLGAEFLENIADDYANIPVLLYAVRDPGSYMIPGGRKQAILRNLHDSVSFSRLSSFCKLYVPVGLPSLTKGNASRFLSIEDEKLYHSSAVYASALHSISLPFRMDQLGPAAESSYVSGAVDIKGVIQMLTDQARQNMVTILDVAMPAPSLAGESIEQSLMRNMNPLTPETTADVDDLQSIECLTVHGAFGAGGRRASISEVKDRVQAAYVHSKTRPKFSHLSVASSPLPIPLPFPSIFGIVVGRHGEILDSPISTTATGYSTRGSLDVHSIPMAARLRSSTAILPFLKNRLGNLRKFGIERGALGSDLLENWGFAKDELQDMGETLSKMIMTLEPPSQISSDSE